MNILSQETKAVGLFYDPNAKEQQELIRYDLKDLNPVPSLDKADPQSNVLLEDIVVIKKLISLLSELNTSKELSKVHKN
jgi:hypothetical protein